jgi:hypothetical protein
VELEIVFSVDGVEFSNESVEVSHPSEELIIAALKARLAVNDDELIEVQCAIDLDGNEFSF